MSLRSLGSEVEAAIPDLVRLFEDRDVRVRGSAIVTAANYGSQATLVVPALGRVLEKDMSSSVRLLAIRGLARIGKPVAGPHLIRALADEDEQVRYEACRALGQIVPTDAQIISVLRKLAQDERDPAMRARALLTLRADDLENLSIFVKALTDSQSQVRRSAIGQMVFAASEHGAKLKSAVPALTYYLKDATAPAREHAAYALGRIGAEARSAVPALEDALRDENPNLRRSAEEALRQVRGMK